jgi:uncharacterized membrane protein YvlD (DUF360 family)
MRFLIRLLISLAAGALGIIVAALLLSGVELTATGFLWALVVYAITQALLLPFIMASADRRDSMPLAAGSGLISTFLALLVADLFTSGLQIEGLGTWFLATVIVWVVSLIGLVVIPWLLLKAGIEHAREARN